MKGSVRLRGETWSYYFKYKDEYGKTRTKEKGGWATKKIALSELRRAIIDFEENNFIATKTKYTLAEYIDYWFENVGQFNLRHGSQTLYQNVKKNHITPVLGDIELTNVTPEQLQSFFSTKQKTVSCSLIKTMKNLLNNTFNLAVKQKIIKVNPMKHIELATIKHDSTKTLAVIDTETLETILRVLDGSKYHAPVMIALHTGMRRGETLGLLWDDIDFEGNTITINKQLLRQGQKKVLSETKTITSNRTIQMTKTLHDYLVILKDKFDSKKAYYQEYFYTDHDFVCCEDNGRPISPECLTGRMRNLSKELGKEFCFHDLRHTHATMMLEADVNVKVLQERLGHGNIGITLNTYSHVTKKLEDQAIERFNSFF